MNIQVLALQAILKVIIRVLESALTDKAAQDALNSIKFESLEEVSPEFAANTRQNFQETTQTYRGFILQVKQEPSTIPGAAKSYVVALDKNGNTDYRGTPSFSSNVNILVEEVKFALDRLID